MHDVREAFARIEASVQALLTLSPGQQRALDVLKGPARHVCLVGGTRSGKSFLIGHEVVGAAVKHPGSRHAMLRFRANAARRSLWLDTVPKVLKRCFPQTRWEEQRQDGYLLLDNGSEIWIGGLDDKERVERILGNEYATMFLNEASQISYSSALVALTRLAQTVPGLTQKAYVDLNPVEVTHWTNRLFGEKRDPISRMPLKNPDAYDREFLNPIDNAANLSRDYLDSLAALPDRQRRRFYEGQYVAELDGALWTSTLLERCRVARTDLPEMKRVVVAIDPAVSSGENANATGIIVAGQGTDNRYYVLADATARYTPTEWASRAISLYDAWKADRIVAETNQGGAMVEATIRAVDPKVAYQGVHASRGKITRAEPISALYEAGRALHAGDGFPELEDEMVSYVPGNTSPDRMDAMVWAITALSSTTSIPQAAIGSFSGLHR